MSRNPYDRRKPDRVAMPDAMFGSRLMTPGTELEYRRGGLTIEDLNAIAWNAQRRGNAEARAEHGEQLAVARQAAWQEGYGAAMVDGRDSLLETIDRQYGAVVRGCVTGLRELVRMSSETRKVPRRDLEHALDNAAGLLAELVDAHHRGFTPSVAVGTAENDADAGEPVRVDLRAFGSGDGS